MLKAELCGEDVHGMKVIGSIEKDTHGGTRRRNYKCKAEHAYE